MKAFQIIILFTLFAAKLTAQTSDIPTDAASISNGQKIYEDQCSRCHLFGEQKLGPSLASVEDRRSVSWLLGFIQNSQTMIQSGDPYAVHLYKAYNQMIMPNFMDLSEEDRMDILAYIKHKSVAKDHDYAKDSMNYYDEEILSMAKNRYVQKDAEETDYYGLPIEDRVPNMLEAIQRGEALYVDQCQTCHTLDKRTTGPALASVTDRRPVSWLLDFIDSPKEMMESGDDYANFMVMNYALVMPDFKFLTKEDKLAILAYIKHESGALTHTAGANANGVITYGQDTTSDKVVNTDRPDPDEQEESSYTFFNIAGIVLMVALVIVLVVIVRKAFTTGNKRRGDDEAGE